jgi:hypothetical protein
MTDSNTVCRYEEATELIASTQDPKVRAALEYALTTVIVRRGMSPSIAPATQFDLRYYLEAIKAMFEDEATVRAIIDGNDRDLRW